jgi:hypothetical protein
MLVDFVAYRETPQLDSFVGYVSPETPVAWVMDRLAGLAVAFHPAEHESYLRSFGWAAWLVPLAGVYTLWRRPGWRAVADPERVVVTATVLTGAGALAFTHGAHLQYMPLEWLFGARAGLPLVFLLAVASAVLLRAGRAWRIVASAMLAVSALLGLLGVAPHVRALPPEPPAAERALFAWIDGHRDPPLILAPQARVLAAHSRGRFHWIHCQDRPAQTLRYLALFDFDYVVVRRGRAQRCPFLGPELHARLEPVERFGNYLVLRPKRIAGAPPRRKPQPAAGLSQR